MGSDGDAPTPSRVEMRKRYWRETGSKIAGAITEIIGELHATVLSSPVAFNAESGYLEHLIAAYFLEIDTFKETHRFRLDARANETKRAAFTVKVLLDVDGARLFNFPPELRGSVYPDLARAQLAFHLACGYLGVSTATVEPEMERVIMHCLSKRLQISDEWLIVAMALFQKNYAQASYPAAED